MVDPSGMYRRISGLFTGSRWFSKQSYRLFLWIYRRRGWRYFYQVSVSFAFTYATSKVIALHKLPDTNLFQAALAIGTGFIVVVALAVASLPLAIIAYGRRRGRGRDRHMASQLYSTMDERAKGREGSSAEEFMPEMLPKLESISGRICIVSRNSFYLQADHWNSCLGNSIESEEVRTTLGALAPYAQEFRRVLMGHSGPLHWVLPDPKDRQIQVLLLNRAQTLGLEPAWVAEANKRALQWLNGDLASRRKKLGRRTHIHLCGFLPRFRLLLTEEDLVFQQYPASACGFMSPIHNITKLEAPATYAAARLAATCWCEVD